MRAASGVVAVLPGGPDDRERFHVPVERHLARAMPTGGRHTQDFVPSKKQLLADEGTRR
jgi:hypothetical protein